MTAAIIALSAVVAGLVAALGTLALRHWKLERDWSSTSERAWKAEAAAETARVELAQALQRVDVERDNAALYKTQLTTEQLKNLRETKGIRNDIESIQRIGSVAERVRAGKRVFDSVTIAPGADYDHGDENPTVNLRAPTAATDSTKS